MTARYFMLINRFTGVQVIIDTWARRLSRMRARVFIWADLVKEFYPEAECKMITLTYDTLGTLGEVYLPEANDIREFTRLIKKELGSKLLAYAWVSEVTEKGSLHYHYLAVVVSGTVIEFPDKSGTWDKGMSNIKNSESGVYYICGHLQKGKQKDFSKYPKGARLFAVWVKVGGDVLRKRTLAGYRNVIKEEGWMSSFAYADASDNKSYLEDVIYPSRVAAFQMGCHLE